jgi:hypothetical protein
MNSLKYAQKDDNISVLDENSNNDILFRSKTDESGFAFLKIGKGHAIQVFSLVLGMQSIDKKTFPKCLKSLSDNGKNIKEEVLEIARNVVRRKHQEVDPFLKDDGYLTLLFHMMELGRSVDILHYMVWVLS